MYTLAVTFLENSGIPLAVVCALIGLAFAFALIRAVIGAPTGNARMREIAAAIEEGAKAYVGRQLRWVSIIRVLLLFPLFFFKDAPTALGFLLGAACSMAAGFIGMRIAVIANVRTADGATHGRQKALQAAFNGGA